MAFEGNIDQIYEVERIQQQHETVKGFVSEFVADMKKAHAETQKLGFTLQEGDTKNMNTLIAKVKQLSTELEKVKDATAANNAAVKAKIKVDKQLRTETAKLTIAQKEYIKNNNATAASHAKLSLVQNNNTKELASNRLELQKLSAEQKLQIRVNSAAEGSLDQLQARLALAKRAYKDMSAEVRNSGIGKAMLTEIQGFDSAVKKIEQSTGNFSRSVGNYSIATTQIVRELPAFGQSLQMGVLAISNNVGQLQDEIGRMSKEGKNAAQIMKKLGKDLLSVNTAIIVGIALMIKYGDELFGASEATKAAKQATKDYEESLKSIDKTMKSTIAEETTRLEILTKVATDTTMAMDERLAAVDNLQKEYPAYLGNLEKEKILNGDIADAIGRAKDAILLKASAQAAEKKLVAVSEKLLELSDKRAKAEQELSKATEEREKVNAIEAKNADEREKRGDAQFFAITRETQAKADLAKIIELQNESVSDQNRLLEEAVKLSAKAGVVLANEEESRKGVTESIKAQVEALGREAAITPIVIKQSLEYAEIKDNGALETIKDNVGGVASEEVGALIELETRFNLNLISYEQYQSEKTRIALEHEEKRIKAEIEGLRSVLIIGGLDAKEREDIERKLQKAELDLIEEGNKAKIKSDKATAKEREQIEKDLSKRRQELQQLVVSTAKQVASSLLTITKNNSEARLSQYDRELDKVDRDRETKINSINATTSNETERIQAVAKAEQDAATQREQIERKKIEEQARNAQFQKNATMAQISLETALAVVRALTDKSTLTPYERFANAAAAGVIGASQLAVAASTPIPQYKDGTKKGEHKGGLAVVGDGGEPELINTGSKTFWSPSTDTLMNLPAGTEVTPLSKITADSESLMFASMANQAMMQSGGDIKLVAKVLDDKLSRFVDKVGNMTQYNTTVTERGFSTQIKRGNSTTNFYKDSL